MGEVFKGQYVLAEVSEATKDVLELEIGRVGLHRFVENAEHALRAQNPGLYSLMAQLLVDRGFSDEQITAAREAMVLTHELLRREAEAFVLRMTI